MPVADELFVASVHEEIAMMSRKLVSATIVGLTIVVIGVTFAQSGFAATASGPEARYQQDRADCLAGKTAEDLKTCLKEAGARLQAARRNDLSSPSPEQLAANARKRCDVFKGDDRATCLARLEQGTTIGSVAAGGELREYREIVPAPESMPPTAAGPAHTAQPLPQGQ
jgi:hypothetical protein